MNNYYTMKANSIRFKQHGIKKKKFKNIFKKKMLIFKNI